MKSETLKETRLEMDMIGMQLKAIIGIYRDAIGRFGISENEFWIWYSLTQFEEEMSQQDICNMWSLSKQTVNSIIANWVKKGLVILETVPGSRNKKIIRTTEIGYELGQNVVAPIISAESSAYKKLPLEERNACATALQHFCRLLQEEFN